MCWATIIIHVIYPRAPSPVGCKKPPSSPVTPEAKGKDPDAWIPTRSLPVDLRGDRYRGDTLENKVGQTVEEEMTHHPQMWPTVGSLSNGPAEHQSTLSAFPGKSSPFGWDALTQGVKLETNFLEASGSKKDPQQKEQSHPCYQTECHSITRLCSRNTYST